MSGAKVSLDTYMLAVIADYLGWLVWSKTKDGQKNRNRPKSILDIINGKGEEKEENQNRTFTSGEEFERLRQELLEKAEKGG